MQATPVILIFDVGKTNKKILLFDEQYRVVQEESTPFDEMLDEDGFACEDVSRLTSWILDSFEKMKSNPAFEIKAVNFSAYGASFVYVDKQFRPALPLYNYLKPYPKQLQNDFYSKYGGEVELSKITASPVLGSLNSGLQLYRIQHENPEQFKAIKWALHLPQYLSAILTKEACSELTSIGCHTLLWDFTTNSYHHWVNEEGIASKLPPIVKGDHLGHSDDVKVGAGLHDSSAALIPYLANFHEPFILLSTGTWCISLNPFNPIELTSAELENDCLCYISYQGKPVKASRLFAGYQHEQQLKRLSEHYQLPAEYFNSILFDLSLIQERLIQPAFESRSLSEFASPEMAYHELILDLVKQQIKSTRLVLEGSPVKRIFVDGGFSKNSIYMNLLAAAFPDIEVFAATVAQASALGAALAIHGAWNNKAIPADLIGLKFYSTVQYDQKA